MDIDTDGRWLTYAELARARGIGRPSAVKLAKREGWQRQQPNDRSREVRVLVPTDWLVPANPGSVAESFAHPDPTITELSRIIDAVTARAERAWSLAEQWAAELQAERQRADRAEAALAARQALGRWARLRAAWRGE
jgi:hypothetical protein